MDLDDDERGCRFRLRHYAVTLLLAYVERYAKMMMSPHYAAMRYAPIRAEDTARYYTCYARCCRCYDARYSYAPMPLRRRYDASGARRRAILLLMRQLLIAMIVTSPPRVIDHHYRISLMRAI